MRPFSGRGRGGRGRGGQRSGSQRPGNQNQNQNQTSEEKEKKPAVNDDKLCKIHAKWKDNANFCAAPWACRMKNVYKAPQ